MAVKRKRNNIEKRFVQYNAYYECLQIKLKI